MKKLKSISEFKQENKACLLEKQNTVFGGLTARTTEFVEGSTAPQCDGGDTDCSYELWTDSGKLLIRSVEC